MHEPKVHATAGDLRAARLASRGVPATPWHPAGRACHGNASCLAFTGRAVEGSAAPRLSKQRFRGASLPSAPCCSAGLGAVRTFIFERRDDFPEILDFVRAMDARYGLRLEELEGEFRSGLASLIRRSGVKAIVLGTRRRDPALCLRVRACGARTCACLETSPAQSAQVCFEQRVLVTCWLVWPGK